MAKTKALGASDVQQLIKKQVRSQQLGKIRIARGLRLVPRRRQHDIRWSVLISWQQHGGKEQSRVIGDNYDPERHAHYLAELDRAREALGEKRSPLNVIGKRAAMGTFEEAAEEWLVKREAACKANDGSIKNCKATRACLTRRYPTLGAMPLTSITVDDIERALGADKPGPKDDPNTGDWWRTPPSARTARWRIAKVIQSGFDRAGLNLANPGESAKRVLTKAEHQEKSHSLRSVEPAEVPAAFRELAATKRAGYRGWGSLALRFTILTAARGDEVMEMRWEHVNWRTRSWDRPAKLMKTRLPHRVALSEAALALLRELQPFARDNPFVFQGQKPGTGLTHNALRTAMSKTSFGQQAAEQQGAEETELPTPHGFRTSFHDWWRTGDPSWARDFLQEHVDYCLAHLEGNRVRRAYMKNDLLEQRRKLMELWGQFVTGTGASPVVLVERRA